MTPADRLAAAFRRLEVKKVCSHLGKNYEHEVAPFRRLIHAVQKRDGADESAAAVVLQKDLERVGKLTPYVGALILAAAVDVADEGRPSTMR